MSVFTGYLKLIRFDKPIGTLLLWFPTAWALTIANQGKIPLRLMILFMLGTFFMRSAGCIINDLADRKIDPHVARTKERPLANHDLSILQALVLLLIFLLLSLTIALMLPRDTLFYAIFGLVITLIYPFCKRFFEAPQLVLGLAFSMGIPIAFVASEQVLNWQSYVLFLLNFFWIISYDTCYAMSDKEDDLKIGVHSTALLFEPYEQSIIALLQIMTHTLWLMIAFYSHCHLLFYLMWLFSFFLFSVQHYWIGMQSSSHYVLAFRSNGLYGALMWVGLILGLRF